MQFYVAELNRSLTEPSQTILPALSTASCNFCAKNQSIATELVTKKYRYDREPVTLGTVTPFDGAPTGQQYYQGTLRQVGAHVVDTAGAHIRTDEKARGAINFVVVWSGGRWMMRGVEHT